jgi:hypothetical protein
MSNLVDIRALGPPSQQPTRDQGHDRDAPDPNASRVTHAEGATPVPRLYGPYRKTRRDLSCIRVIAASTIVAGLLLGTAPTALAQVGHLLVTVPVAFIQELSGQAVSSTGASAIKNDSAPTDITVRHRSSHHSWTSIFGSTGTGQASRCSGSLVLEGNTRTCEAA